MTKEEYDKLSDDDKEMMQIGAKCLTRIINEMEKCEVGEDESVLIFSCKDADGEPYFFNVTGYKQNSPQKHDV